MFIPNKSPNQPRGPFFPASSGRDFSSQRKKPKIPRLGPSVWRLLGLDISHSIASLSPWRTELGLRSQQNTLTSRLWKLFPLQAVCQIPQQLSGKYFWGGEYVFLRCFPPKKIAYKFLFEVIENHAIFRMARLRGRGAENDGKGVRVWWLQNLQWAIIPTCFTKSFRCQTMQESWTFCRLGGEVSTFILVGDKFTA